MSYYYLSTPTTTEWNQTTIDLVNTFCCPGGTGTIIKWNSCSPSVFRGPSTVFSASDLGFCGWEQSVTEWSYATYELKPTETVSVSLVGLFLLVKAKWNRLLKLEYRNIELRLPNQEALVGETLPFQMGGSSSQNLIFRDFFLINTSNVLGGIAYLNNLSVEPVKIHLLTAN